MKRALITGGAGFCGRALVRRLADDGWQVEAVDNLFTGIRPKEWAFPPVNGFTFTYMDVRDFFKRTHPSHFDLIIHCAAVVGGRLKIEGDPIGVATDLAIDSDFFRWLVRGSGQRPKVVYFSSSAVYPVELQTSRMRMRLSEFLVAFDKTRIGMPDATYGWAKLTGELLAQHAVAKHGADIVSYRPFSGYGEDQDPSYPFPAIMRRIAAKENPITVWGSGEQCRDFIHIDDIVEGVLSTLWGFEAGAVLNLGTGVETSFRNLANAADAIAGRESDIQADTTKPEGVFYRVADIYRMNQLFKPKITLAEGIERSLKFLQKTVDKAPVSV